MRTQVFSHTYPTYARVGVGGGLQDQPAKLYYLHLVDNQNFHLVQSFSASLSPLQRLVEDINDQASDFTANSVALSRQILQRLEDINTRCVDM